MDACSAYGLPVFWMRRDAKPPPSNKAVEGGEGRGKREQDVISTFTDNRGRCIWCAREYYAKGGQSLTYQAALVDPEKRTTDGIALQQNLVNWKLRGRDFVESFIRGMNQFLHVVDVMRNVTSDSVVSISAFCTDILNMGVCTKWIAGSNLYEWLHPYQKDLVRRYIEFLDQHPELVLIRDPHNHDNAVQGSLVHVVVQNLLEERTLTNTDSIYNLIDEKSHHTVRNRSSATARGFRSTSHLASGSRVGGSTNNHTQVTNGGDITARKKSDGSFLTKIFGCCKAGDEETRQRVPMRPPGGAQPPPGQLHQHHQQFRTTVSDSSALTTNIPPAHNPPLNNYDNRLSLAPRNVSDGKDHTDEGRIGDQTHQNYNVMITQASQLKSETSVNNALNGLNVNQKIQLQPAQRLYSLEGIPDAAANLTNLTPLQRQMLLQSNQPNQYAQDFPSSCPFPNSNSLPPPQSDDQQNDNKNNKNEPSQSNPNPKHSLHVGWHSRSQSMNSNINSSHTPPPPLSIPPNNNMHGSISAHPHLNTNDGLLPILEDNQENKVEPSKNCGDADHNPRPFTNFPPLFSFRNPRHRSQDDSECIVDFNDLCARVDVCVSVAKGIDEMHRQSVGHFDIALKNIMFDVKTKKAVVIDLGSACRLDSDGAAREVHENFAFSRSYIHPARRRGQLWTSKDDSHSLLLVISEVLGSPPSEVWKRLSNKWESPYPPDVERLGLARWLRGALLARLDDPCKPTVSQILQRLLFAQQGLEGWKRGDPVPSFDFGDPSPLLNVSPAGLALQETSNETNGRRSSIFGHLRSPKPSSNNNQQSHSNQQSSKNLNDPPQRSNSVASSMASAIPGFNFVSRKVGAEQNSHNYNNVPVESAANISACSHQVFEDNLTLTNSSNPNIPNQLRKGPLQLRSTNSPLSTKFLMNSATESGAVPQFHPDAPYQIRPFHNNLNNNQKFNSLNTNFNSIAPNNLQKSYSNHSATFPTNNKFNNAAVLGTQQSVVLGDGSNVIMTETILDDSMTTPPPTSNAFVSKAVNNSESTNNIYTNFMNKPSSDRVNEENEAILPQVPKQSLEGSASAAQIQKLLDRDMGVVGVVNAAKAGSHWNSDQYENDQH